MHTNTPNPQSLPLNEARFMPIGPQEIPWSRLFATLHSDGRTHHLDAIALQDHPTEGLTPVEVDSDGLLADLYRDCGDNTAFRTAEIDGREYILAITPFAS